MCYRVHLLDIRDDEVLNSHGHSGRIVEYAEDYKLCVVFVLFFSFFNFFCTCLSLDGLFCYFSLLGAYS